MKQTYPIQGMHCASCASIITDKVSKLDGVQSCEVNFATKNATIEYDDTKIQVQGIAQEVEKYGYSLTIPVQEDTQDNSHQEHISNN